MILAMSGRFESGKMPDADGVAKLKKPFEIAELLVAVKSALEYAEETAR